MKKGIEKRLNENHFPSIVDNIFRHEKRSKMSADRLWLTAKAEKDDIY